MSWKKTGNHIIVIDSGTSGLRCTIFDSHDEIVSCRGVPWSYISTSHISTFAKEFDSQRIWFTICMLVKSVLRDSDISPSEISGITATSQRQAVAFLDGKGNDIYVGPNLDFRAIFEGGMIDEKFGERIYSTTGHSPTFMLALAKLKWFQMNQPDSYERITFRFTLADWILFKLSGEIASEPSLAGGIGLIDISSRTWCNDLLADLNMEPINNIPLVESGTMIGCLTRKTSEETSLMQKTPVFVSGADTQCGLLGMSINDTYHAGIVAGWSTPIQIVVGNPLEAHREGMWIGCNVIPGQWVLESSAGDSGFSINWLKNTVWGNSKNPFEEMDEHAEALQPGAGGVVSFLGASRMNMKIQGVKQGGIHFPVPLSHNQIGKEHLAKSALESIAYAIRANLEQGEAFTDNPLAYVSVGGGMTRLSSFTQILPDVLGRPVAISPTHNVTAIGSYLCARFGLGEFVSLSEASGIVRKRLTIKEPDVSNTSEYNNLYVEWAQMSETLNDNPL